MGKIVKLNLHDLRLAKGEVRSLALEQTNLFVVTGELGLPEIVLIDKCAHMGSPLKPTRNGFTCESHGWTYKRDGANWIAGNPGLETVPFVIEDDEIVFELREKEPILGPRDELDGTESLELLAHASFLLSSGESRVLFDPWLDGPTYWGSWHHFPKNAVSAEELTLSHVVITHPHPDHFHLPTIEKIDRNVPIIIPNFESGILQEELRKLEFRDIQLLGWEEELWLNDNVGLAFLRPVSQWEDASCLVRVKDWIWLNQNDSGSVLRDDLIPEQLDLLTTSFDTGASGWPLTWDLSDGRKEAIVRASKQSILDTIKTRCVQLNARYFAPFAGWWRHGLDIHQGFSMKIEHTTHEDLLGVLAGTGTQLIPTIPSSVIRLADMSHSWDETVFEQLGNDPVVEPFHPPSRELTDRELEISIHKYMRSLEKLSPASDCEPVSFVLRIPDADFVGEFRFGNKKILEITSISVEIPGWVAELLVSEDSTAIWNHFDIGYWGRWSRTPDVYPANFMRLLQLGLPRKLLSNEYPEDSGVVGKMAVTDFIEKDPELARAILSRAGLPCSSCVKANSDTLENAFTIHGTSKNLRLRTGTQLAALLAQEN